MRLVHEDKPACRASRVKAVVLLLPLKPRGVGLTEPGDLERDNDRRHSFRWSAPIGLARAFTSAVESHHRNAIVHQPIVVHARQTGLPKFAKRPQTLRNPYRRHAMSARQPSPDQPICKRHPRPPRPSAHRRANVD